MTRTHAHEEEKEIVATITKVLLLTVRMAVGVEGRASEGGGGRNMNDDAIVEKEEAPIFPMPKQTLFALLLFVRALPELQLFYSWTTGRQ